MNTEDQLKKKEVETLSDEFKQRVMGFLADCLRENKPFVFIDQDHYLQRDFESGKDLIFQTYHKIRIHEAHNILIDFG